MEKLIYRGERVAVMMTSGYNESYRVRAQVYNGILRLGLLYVARALERDNLWRAERYCDLRVLRFVRKLIVFYYVTQRVSASAHIARNLSGSYRSRPLCESWVS